LILDVDEAFRAAQAADGCGRDEQSASRQAVLHLEPNVTDKNLNASEHLRARAERMLLNRQLRANVHDERGVVAEEVNFGATLVGRDGVAVKRLNGTASMRVHWPACSTMTSPVKVVMAATAGAASAGAVVCGCSGFCDGEAEADCGAEEDCAGGVEDCAGDIAVCAKAPSGQNSAAIAMRAR
jgi:hypothetical protein